MADFIAEVVGQEKTSEGNVVTVRMTGFGAADGPLMTRAKARAIATSSFGSNSVTGRTTTNEKGFLPIEENGETNFVPGYTNSSEDTYAEKGEGLFSGPASKVRDKLQAFRSNGLFAEVKDYKELKTDRVIDNEKLQDVFGPLMSAVSTYQYDILITTNYSF